jgi:hypothetical protein
MRVAITGASGLIGRGLTGALVERGDEAVPARRGDAPDARLRWDVAAGFDPPDALSGFDAVVHLAAENLSSGRWTDSRKATIRDSRVDGTRAVVAALQAADPRPRVLLSASGSSIYLDDTQEVLDESGPRGRGFLAEVCEAWEAEARRAEDIPGVRVVITRMGAVLGPNDGALAKMLPIFRLGLGGHVGGGEQPMSWVHRDDVARAMLWLLDHDDASGAYNVCAPEPTTNFRFTRALGRALHRPAIIPVPAVALRLLYGEMADVVLHGQRMVPRRLLDDGFRFEHADLDDALRDLVA